MAAPSIAEQIEIFEQLVNDPALFERFRQDPVSALAVFNLDEAFIRLLHQRFTTIEDVKKQLTRLSGTLSTLKPSPPSLEEEEEEMEELAPEEASSKRRIVNTGFVPDDAPETEIEGNRTLGINKLYHFWFDIADKPSPKSIERTPTSLPTNLPGDAELDVVLFEFPSQAKMIVGNPHGKIKLKGNFSEVIKPADAPRKLLENIKLRLQRLFFTIKTPEQPGKYQLRNNIYFQGTLLQSRLITIQVTDNERHRHAALTSEVDYTLSQIFAPRQLAQMGQNHLSILLNDDGDGTHGLRLFGQNDFVGNATLGDDAVKALIETSRQELRLSAWGNKKPYQSGNKYLYSGTPNPDRLKIDLIRMALRGYEFYDTVITNFAGDVQTSYQLADMMRQPGQVQISAKETVQMVLPAAMIYDHPLDNGITDARRFSVCPEFISSLNETKPLEETRCFQGDCPSYGEDTIVCPSGFWGFRHFIGLPVSVKAAPDAPLTIPNPSAPKMSVSVSTDPQFKRREKHEEVISNLGLMGGYADSRTESLDLLKNNSAQMVYYYCHGGLSNGRPYIKVGPNNDGERLTPANLRTKRILFDEIQPLVFINGCHTTALTPDNGFDMVTAFIQTAQAAGVIGTEITIFESIAVAFSEEFFKRFLVMQQTVGEAVRGSRLHMLKNGNPLGLVYVPYALPGLRLTKE
ncbi:MAG: C25 family cysteine peptidase [Chloroflexota bacterium]